jgi:hypothetical protein
VGGCEGLAAECPALVDLARKQFFFEKKNQKTFLTMGWWWPVFGASTDLGRFGSVLR